MRMEICMCSIVGATGRWNWWKFLKNMFVEAGTRLDPRPCDTSRAVLRSAHVSQGLEPAVCPGTPAGKLPVSASHASAPFRFPVLCLKRSSCFSADAAESHAAACQESQRSEEH